MGHRSFLGRFIVISSAASAIELGYFFASSKIFSVEISGELEAPLWEMIVTWCRLWQPEQTVAEPSPSAGAGSSRPMAILPSRRRSPINRAQPGLVLAVNEAQAVGSVPNWVLDG